MAKTRGAPEVIRHLRQYDARYRATVENVLIQQAHITTQRLKAEAPWQDRTGAARAGLSAGVQTDGRAYTLRARHQVPYGVFLEYAHQGRLQVLRPVMRTQWPRAVRAVGKALKEIRSV